MAGPGLLTIHTDGASRGNPGAAAYAYVIEGADEGLIEEAGCLGELTNNQAEYTALARALEHALELGAGHRVAVHSDSELIVKQLNGEYRVKNEELRPLYERVQHLRQRFEQPVTFRHVRREQNRRADQLCNEALDGKRLPTRITAADLNGPPPKKAPAAPAAAPGLREEALACLNAAALSWARGNPGKPTDEELWDQLAGLVRKHGGRLS